MHEMTIPKDDANVFRTLSAYFTTTATINPPTAWTIITVQTMDEYPTKNPFSTTAAPSWRNTVTNEMIMDGRPIWIFLIQSEVVDPFKIFSKYTPENPDVQAAQRMATRPRARFWSLSFSGVEVSPDVWTTATPIVSMTSAAHFVLENLRWSIVALNNAVVRILSW